MLGQLSDEVKQRFGEQVNDTVLPADGNTIYIISLRRLCKIDAVIDTTFLPT